MKKVITVNEKVDLLRQMIEMGGDVRASFHFISTKKEAKAIIEKFAEMMDVSYKEYDSYFSIYDLDTPIDLAVHFKLSKEEQREALVKQIAEIDGHLVEDVDLSGGVEDDHRQVI